MTQLRILETQSDKIHYPALLKSAGLLLCASFFAGLMAVAFVFCIALAWSGEFLQGMNSTLYAVSCALREMSFSRLMKFGDSASLTLRPNPSVTLHSPGDTTVSRS